MKKNTMKGRMLVIILTLFMLAISGLCYGMYAYTRYALYFYLYITSLLFGGTNLLFILLKLRCERTPRIKVKVFQKIFEKLPLIFRTLCFVGYGLVVVFGGQSIIVFLKNSGTAAYPAVSNVVIFLLLFVSTLVLEKLCEYTKENTPFVNALLSDSQTFMKLLMFESIVAAACTVFESLKFFLIQTYVGYILTILIFYYVACILLSMIVIAIRKEFTVCPYLNIPLTTLRKKNGEEDESRKTVGFIEYLETNTGISMRSLWSVKFIRQIAPLVVVLSGLFLWLSTCIVQVESYQKAAVYRLGVLQEKLLESGIHLTLPYPFDKVEVYDTEVLNRTTIGFRAETSADNLWTSSHQGEEYKLLLGSSDEVVSINLRLEYKISDLVQYLESSAAPESILQALAYELVTDQTIHTDLSTILTTDREVFSQNFMEELAVMLEEKKVGLEVVSVVLESIHPPKEIAEVYQKTVSAEIDAEATILDAEAMAVSALAKAQISYDEAVSLANSEYAQSVAEAKSTIAEFMASVEANNTYGEKYTYQKYLNAFRKAYGKANLVIVSEGIDQSAIYFGSFSSGDSSSDDRNLGDGSTSGSSGDSKNDTDSEE